MTANAAATGSGPNSGLGFGTGGNSNPESDSAAGHHSSHVAELTSHFADFPTGHLQLRPFDAGSNNKINPPPSPQPSAQSVSGHQQLQHPQQSQSALTIVVPHNPRARRPSPGLVARLKNLGFSGTKKSPSSSPPLPPPLLPPPQLPTFDHVGRLDESLIHLLDENHAAASSSAVVVERRGRPWKGVSASASANASATTADAVAAVAAPSPSPKSRSVTFDLPAVAVPPAATEQDFASPGATDAYKDHRYHRDDFQPSPGLLPEIASSDPLDMDTHKYRLPDHTNGNGTKVQLDTRREHIERSVRPPSPDQDDAPPPPPKDSPAMPLQADFVPNLTSYFTPGHHRPGSIYTLSRASFANQLAQLTSLQLPDAESLSSRVSAIPTAQAATTALINAAEQIRSWVSKASEVIGGLDSDDDVEWAAAGGREGLAEVENAIIRFEELINVYVSAVEELNLRPDILNVASDDLKRAVAQMDSTVADWKKIRVTLHTVKAQVEIAMEWEELWNMVLGDIQNEMDELGRLVFEMEERRHRSLMAAASGEGVDIGDLETIVEETPPQQTRLQAQNRFSLPAFPLSPSSPSAPTMTQDDGSLLALFARMQPLRASLEFLPMRLSVFEARAHHAFPTACEELEMRQTGLDASYKKLEADAESLRKELGEDKWVLVFRNAGRQAQKMVESVERAVLKLKEGIDAGMHLTNQPMMSKKIESYEAKKTHYGPAIDRIITIIDKGVKERLTVNGEIMRVHAEMQGRWESLKEQMRETDILLEEVQTDKRGQQLRDSISSMLSNDRSTIGSGQVTPGSSPPSSVIMSSLGLDPTTPTAKLAKHRSGSIGSHLPQPANRRHSSMPVPAQSSSQLPTRAAAGSRLSMLGRQTSEMTPATASKIQRPSSTLGHRPRWNGSTNANLVDTGHNFKPMSLTTPSQYSKRTPAPARSVSSLTPTSSGSRLPALRSPISRSASESPRPDDTPTRPNGSHLSFRERIAAASPAPSASSMQGTSKPRLATQASLSALNGNRRASSFQPRLPSQQQQPQQETIEETPRPARPVSSLATAGRRVSMLPQPKTARKDDGLTGRESPQAIAGARVAMRKNSSTEGKRPEPKDLKPRWRG